MSDEGINVTPDVRGTIMAMRNRTMPWSHILGELFDNAFDHGATRIDVTLNGRELAVYDDGTGCDDFAKMLRMGMHSRGPQTKLGRYGVGLKDAAWWVGGPTTISTVSGGIERSGRVDWDRMSTWMIPRPAEISTAARGTTICFNSISKDRRIPDGVRLDELLAELGFIYSPAIKNGRQIVFRRGRHPAKVLTRHELPSLTDIIDTEISVEGRKARVHVGIVPDGVQNLRPGISYAHAFRVIFHSSLGCGSLSSARIAGWVMLGDGWSLARNKDDVSAYKDELGDAVFAAIRPIVEKAAHSALNLRSSSIAASLTSMFRGLVGGAEENAKAKRNTAKNETGRVNPTGDGRPHKDAKNKQRGSRMRDLRAGQFSIEFRDLVDGSIAEVDLPGRKIWLADDHVDIKRAKDAGDTRYLLTVAAMMFVSRDLDSPTPLLDICRDGTAARRIELVLGKLLTEIDGEQLRSIKAVA